ncbi:PREDICTED: tyrosine-protein phosphatase non-receptor type 9-like [Priapulus caudatus]|uniref:Tyrosine-protein phosphatase non-receptor type 9-like n=1 Tax=Priapulus caudatus TaxID=37621 RepID=A0ABM1E817_PRICU|nr:PREDICTED: tyrosine-protein phosphatase non-receptor type 9-like [Priapulus caudatus]
MNSAVAPTDSGPTTDSGPIMNSGPTTDSGPIMNSGPTTDSGPTIDEQGWSTRDRGSDNDSGSTADSWAPAAAAEVVDEEEDMEAEVVDEEEDMEVYTTSVAQLESHVAADALPTSLGGRLAANHDAWTRYCIRRSGVARAADDYCDVTAFLDGKFNQLANMDALIDDGGSGGGGEMPSDVSGEMLDAAVTSSEVGGGGATEKHDSEEREKEVAVEKNGGDGGGGGQGAPPDAYESVHRGDGGYTIEDCVEMVRGKSRGGLYREYGLIRAADTDGTFETSRARHNLVKNRYSDVLCYDHSRVRLRNDGNDDDDDASDYINGNYVDGYKQKHAFISTQGPLPKTFPDFWRMIWQERVLVIVMTTRTIERSRLKCGQYWPLDEEMGEQCGDFLIINAGQQHHKDNIFTTLVVHNTKTGESREVMHCQFTCWPDYGVPHSAAVMLDFLFQVRDIQASAVQALGDAWTGHPLGPPILVHCSAGIGRTGTFCMLDIALQQLADVGTIDVESTVRKIRTQRAHSIQMPDQYVFCHLAVIEYALNEGLLDDVDLTGFDDDEDDDD